jgi:hypothetical protein
MAVNLPTIRSIEEAREALAEVLALPERPRQIISIMEKIMFCRVHEARRFLTDAMDGLIRGGLEEMRRKRREALERKQAEEEAAKAAELEAQIKETSAQRREESVQAAEVPAAESVPEPIVIVPSQDELKVLEELGTQLDALNLAAVAAEIFPDLKGKFEPWEVARAIYANESQAREALLQGARLKDHERATMLAPAWDTIRRLIENSRPSWRERLHALRSVIDEHFASAPPNERGASAQSMFEVLAMRDDHALEVLDSERPAALDLVGGLRQRLDQLLEFEAERKE